MADSTISDADLILRSGYPGAAGPTGSISGSGAPLSALDISVPPPSLFPISGLSDAGDLRQNNSPKRPSLDERLEKELGIKVRNENAAAANGIPDFSKPPPGYGSLVQPGLPLVAMQLEQQTTSSEAENQRLVRVGNMLQIVPEAAKIESPMPKMVPVPAPPKQVCFNIIYLIISSYVHLKDIR